MRLLSGAISARQGLVWLTLPDQELVALTLKPRCDHAAVPTALQMSLTFVFSFYPFDYFVLEIRSSVKKFECLLLYCCTPRKHSLKHKMVLKTKPLNSIVKFILMCILWLNFAD